ncbi:MAG: NUDIX hydrolase [Nevskiales bacterium]|nr:NUDIX hydrolase [Nevskiales bacterium]
MHKVTDGDHLPRHFCPACGTVHYQNPKIIVGCIPEWEDRILMCRRAIEPGLGSWTFPAGFLELNETIREGSARETLEETQAEVEVGELFVVINVPHVRQVNMIHRGRLKAPRFEPTRESSEVVLMREDEIPWDQIVFRTVLQSLKLFYADRAAGRAGFHTIDLPPPPRSVSRTDGNAELQLP